MRCPTPDECTGNLPYKDPAITNGVPAYAMWHPQWGGYSGRCVVQPSNFEGNDCFEVWV
jgi:hypothetical protein